MDLKVWVGVQLEGTSITTEKRSKKGPETGQHKICLVMRQKYNHQDVKDDCILDKIRRKARMSYILSQSNSKNRSTINKNKESDSDWLRKRVDNKYMEIEKAAGTRMNTPKRPLKIHICISERRLWEKVNSANNPHKCKSSSIFIECNSGNTYKII